MRASGVRRTQFAAYTLAIAHDLTAQLTRITALPPAQLSGHAANFDFWSDEVAHCLAVIDNYPLRFERMSAGEREYRLHELLPDFRAGDPFIPARTTSAPGRIPDELRRYVRAELCRAFERFAIACHTCAHLPPECVRGQCQRLGIEVTESDVPLA